MLLRSMSLCLTLGLGINFATASEILNTTTIYEQGEQPLQVAAKLDTRRRGDCGTPPDAWTLNICEPHPFCYVASKTVKLWLSEKQRSGRMDKLVIKKSGTPKGIEERWSASKKTLDWPIRKMPIESGKAYLIKLKNSSSSNEISMYEIPETKQTLDEQVEFMKEKGCTPQVEMIAGQQS